MRGANILGDSGILHAPEKNSAAKIFSPTNEIFCAPLRIIGRMDIKDLLNKSTRYVTATLAEQEIPYRIVEVGGKKLITSSDHDPKRVNLSFRNDRLANYTIG